MHFLTVGDSGAGKSAPIRQMLSQIWERGETAIVYDPALEYPPQLYRESRGDVILNPLDARCPFWTPGDEAPHEAEALTVAASLFPERGWENRFFVDAPRKIFAHLINLKPTPEQLTHWMCHEQEIDVRVQGTEMWAMIHSTAPNQRSGVMGSLNMVADAFRLLPTERETKRRWSAFQWSQERHGWLFLTSKPTMRERLQPLLSLWLDLLVLRLMNEGGSGARKTWFVLDEVATLQRLPQLTTAITESRKSNCPMVLGFQGKAQVETLYGHIAEAMLSQQHPHLSASQRHAVEDVLTSCDRMMALEGVAGAGKTTSLAAVREGAERTGYQVEGLAPTSRAAQKLAEAGIETQTLQRHLARGEQQDDGQKRLYVVDESSMASTKQIHTFVERLKENDRVLFVGDTRQHEAVEAGRPYAQLQDAGMRTARLDEIIRQKDPALKDAVEQLARGEVREAIGNLSSQGRAHEITDRQERISEIAREYVRSPERTLVVSPDNASRREINESIHRTMRSEGKVSHDEQRVHVLYARQDMTGADRQHAQNYERGDVLRYSKGSKPLGIEAGEYARVSHVDRESNMLTVKRQRGEEKSYDPRRLQGVTVYRDSERKFAQGDRVQLTAPYHEQKLANRELATIERIDGDGGLKLRTDSGREVEFNVRQHPHLDYGYAVTSHSSQGQTAERVLIHVDTEQAPGELVNSRMAYVSVSRAQFDVQVYTNDAKALGYELSRDVSHPTAIQQEPAAAQKIEPQSVSIGATQGLSVG
jgi:hypothetical protein